METDLKEFISKRNSLQPEKGPENEYLKAFVGHWKIDGRNGAEAPEAPGAKILGDETYEWMAGEYYLIGKIKRTLDGENFEGLGWIGYDSFSDGYLNFLIVSTGQSRIYEVEVSEEKIVFSGRSERAQMRIDNGVLTVNWEFTPDGKSWKTLCDYTGTKIN